MGHPPALSTRKPALVVASGETLAPTRSVLEAAFTALFDTFIGSPTEERLADFQRIEAAVDAVRRGVPLTREDAEAALGDAPDEAALPAAFVLLYESVGGLRRDYEFGLDQGHMARLWTTRVSLRVPHPRAVTSLLAYAGRLHR